MVWTCRDSLPDFLEVTCDGALPIQEGHKKLGKLRHCPASDEQNVSSCNRLRHIVALKQMLIFLANKESEGGWS